MPLYNCRCRTCGEPVIGINCNGILSCSLCHKPVVAVLDPQYLGPPPVNGVYHYPFSDGRGWVTPPHRRVDRHASDGEEGYDDAIEYLHEPEIPYRGERSQPRSPRRENRHHSRRDHAYHDDDEDPFFSGMGFFHGGDRGGGGRERRVIGRQTITHIINGRRHFEEIEIYDDGTRRQTASGNSHGFDDGNGDFRNFRIAPDPFNRIRGYIGGNNGNSNHGSGSGGNGGDLDHERRILDDVVSRSLEEYNGENGGARPISDSLINRIPLRPVTQQEVSAKEHCGVCLGEYEIGDMVRVLPCDHVYHQGCIDRWLREHGSCPICRIDINLSGLGSRTGQTSGGARTGRSRSGSTETSRPDASSSGSRGGRSPSNSNHGRGGGRGNSRSPLLHRRGVRLGGTPIPILPNGRPGRNIPENFPPRSPHRG